MKERAQIVDDVCEAIRRSPYSIEKIAERAGVHPITIYLWLNGTTANPQADTLDKVARVLGLRLAFADGRFVRESQARSSPPAKPPRLAVWLRQ
jgi:transcriptional regulator with XRE-family HTH domain